MIGRAAWPLFDPQAGDSILRTRAQGQTETAVVGHRDVGDHLGADNIEAHRLVDAADLSIADFKLVERGILPSGMFFQLSRAAPSIHRRGTRRLRDGSVGPRKPRLPQAHGQNASPFSPPSSGPQLGL